MLDFVWFIFLLFLFHSKVKCLLCSRELGYSNNTSSMLRHYRAMHEMKEGHAGDAGGPAQGLSFNILE